MHVLNEEKTIARYFNCATDTYDNHCHLQHFAALMLKQALSSTIIYERVIELGCGTGRNTESIIREIKFLDYLAVDFAKSALCKAKARLALPNCEFIEADFDEFIFDERFASLIISNMAMHWSSNFKALLKKLWTGLAPQGTLVFTLPLKGSLPELQQKSIRHFHTMAEIMHLLALAGYHVIEAKQSQHTNFFNSVWEALNSLKKTGVAQLETPVQFSLRGKEYLTKLYRSTKSMPALTYEVGLFIARKP